MVVFFTSKEPSVSEPMLGHHAYHFLKMRRLFSEVLERFFLVLVTVGGDVVNTATQGAFGQVALVITPALMVMTNYTFYGQVLFLPNEMLTVNEKGGHENY